MLSKCIAVAAPKMGDLQRRFDQVQSMTAPEIHDQPIE